MHKAIHEVNKANTIQPLLSPSASSKYWTAKIVEEWRKVIPDSTSFAGGNALKSIKNSGTHSSSAMKFGASPWQRYSSHIDADPQPLRSLKMSSVKVDPGDPMNTEDKAQIVLSSIASTFKVKIQETYWRVRRVETKYEGQYKNSIYGKKQHQD